MKKKKSAPRWIETLKALIDHKGYNPRSLSIKAGLNATAVRDILEGRAKSPRYETLESLAKALDVTPDELMNADIRNLLKQKNPSSTTKIKEQPPHPSLDNGDLELLTEIISKLQEAADAYKQQLKPQDFAAMVTTIYRHVQLPESKEKKTSITAPVEHLITYETLRKKIAD